MIWAVLACRAKKERSESSITPTQFHDISGGIHDCATDLDGKIGEEDVEERKYEFSFQRLMRELEQEVLGKAEWTTGAIFGDEAGDIT